MNIEKLNRNVCCAKSRLSPTPLSQLATLKLDLPKIQQCIKKNMASEVVHTFFAFLLILFFCFDHFSNDGFSKF